ncbi:MAG: uridine kinase family protein [Candidatus Nanopelagicales bacterium]
MATEPEPWQPKAASQQDASGPDRAAAGPRDRVVLLAGPSGSGKSHLAMVVGIPIVHLDDFYKSGSDPTCPRHPQLGIVDWDDPRSWNADQAVAALETLCATGQAEVPEYCIGADGPIGTRHVEVGVPPFVAEGVFASELAPVLRERGLLLDAIVVRRPRWKNLLRRTVRDFRERRKPPMMILRRSVNLYRSENEVVARAVRAGFRQLNAQATSAALQGHLAGPGDAAS